MTPTLARRLLLASLILGIAGNWLLRTHQMRAGMVVWILGVLGVALIASVPASEGDPSAGRERRVLLGTACILALLLVLRDAEILFGLDLFALVVTSALVAWRAGGRSLATLEPRDAVVGGLAGATAILAGAPTLALRDASPPAVDAERRRSFGGFAIGAIIAAPVLLLVTGLLGSADPLFANFLDGIGEMLDVGLAGHIVGTIAAAWVAAGAIRGSLEAVDIGVPTLGLKLRLPFPVVAPLLIGLAIILSAWIGLQVRVLFGGTEYVAATTGVTVAAYAREGFFQLVVIAGIVLAALLVTDEVMERESSARVSFQRIGFVLLGLVGAVLLSALQRLSLYLRFFGLTDDRVMALAVLIWVALMLSWFGWTVLRDRRARFAPGVLVISAIWLGSLNLVNPEGRIVETNLRRAERGLTFDIKYHARLSGDALPALLDGAERLGAVRAAELRAEIATVWAKRKVDRPDWREWSLPYLLGARRLEQQ